MKFVHHDLFGAANSPQNKQTSCALVKQARHTHALFARVVQKDAKIYYVHIFIATHREFEPMQHVPAVAVASMYNL